MCGIIGLMKKDREKALEMARKIRHRGPDGTGIYEKEGITMVHERLAIIDPASGGQPLVDSKTGRVLVAVGEIYGYKKFIESLKEEHVFQTKSDCEVLLYLYDEKGPDFVKDIDGMFSFVIHDPKTGETMIARDHMGIIPLYIGWDETGITHFASELKALDGFCTKIKEFPPGHYYLESTKEFVRWYSPKWAEKIPDKQFDLHEFKEKFETSVKSHLMSDVPLGLLISGGLDSSVVAAIAQKYSDEQLLSFSVGLKGSPDLFHARKMAKHIGTKHHEIEYTIQEGFDALRDVIYHLETFDITTIRASTPMYLMSRKIKSLGVKVVLSGEGADELFGGYLYFHHAPSKEEFHEETVRKLFKLSKYDCLRANKSTMAWGVEARVPFLDRTFMDYAMSLDPEVKMCDSKKMEKWIIRKAFEDYLPKEVAWRQKEQFSDGVGYGWIDFLKAHAEEVVSDTMLAYAEYAFPEKTPDTKEGYFYRMIFEELFSKTAVDTVPMEKSVACSTPTALRWMKFDTVDPSGRAVAKVHVKAY